MKTNTLIPNKTILVAGATNPVGTGIVRYFLTQGATVIAPAINQHDLTILKEIGNSIKTGNLVTQLAQLPDYDQAFDIAEATAEKFGNIDIGISIFNSPPCNKPLTNALISDWLNMLDEELTPFFVSASIILQSMKLNRQGLYVSICDSSFFEAAKPAPFIKITAGIKMEMSKIFAEESENFNVRYKHLWTDLSEENHQLFQQNETSIGQWIFDIYLNDALPGNIFQQTTKVA